MWVSLRLRNNLVRCDSYTPFRLAQVVLERSVRVRCHEFRGEEDVFLQPALPMLSRSRAWYKTSTEERTTYLWQLSTAVIAQPVFSKHLVTGAGSINMSLITSICAGAFMRKVRITKGRQVGQWQVTRAAQVEWIGSAAFSYLSIGKAAG